MQLNNIATKFRALQHAYWSAENTVQSQRTEIQSLRDRISQLEMSEVQINAHNSELQFQVVKLIERTQYAERELAAEIELVNQSVSIRRGLFAQCNRFARYVNKLYDENIRLRNVERNLRNAIEDTNDVIRVKNADIAEMRMQNRSLISQLEKVVKAKHEIQYVPVMCDVTSDMESIPDFVGYAACGNGCKVKRTNSGGMYDDHEYGCEMNENEPVEF